MPDDHRPKPPHTSPDKQKLEIEVAHEAFRQAAALLRSAVDEVSKTTLRIELLASAEVLELRAIAVKHK